MYGSREYRPQAHGEGPTAEETAAMCESGPGATVGIGAVIGLIPGSVLGAVIGLLAGNAGKGALIGMGVGLVAGGAGMYAMHQVARKNCP